MGRTLKPENQALQDRIAAVLADAWPELLTSAQVAERVGGMRTIWEVCHAFRWPDGTCRQGSDRRFPGTHHPGPVPQDSWEIPYDAMAMNPPLNRLARDGQVHKVKVQALRGVLWQWAGDSDTPSVDDLELMWQVT